MKAILSNYWWEREVENRKGNEKANPNDPLKDDGNSKVSYLRVSRFLITLPG